MKIVFCDHCNEQCKLFPDDGHGYGFFWVCKEHGVQEIEKDLYENFPEETIRQFENFMRDYPEAWKKNGTR